MKQVFKLLSDNLLESLSTLTPLLEALKLWSLNLIFPLCFILVSPMLVKDLTDMPLFIFTLFKAWLVGGVRFQIVFYMLCLITVIFEEK